MNGVGSTVPLYVAGIDSGLARTGVAVIELLDRKCRAQTFVIATEPGDDKSPAAGYERVETITRRVEEVIPARGLLLGLLEAPAYGAEGAGQAWLRAGLWWALVGVFVRRLVPLGTIAPLTVKKWATGFGGSPKRPVEKRAIVAAMAAMWPGLPCTRSSLRHHECEALAMAHICGQRLKWPVPVRARHERCLGAVNWPKHAAVQRRLSAGRSITAHLSRIRPRGNSDYAHRW